MKWSALLTSTGVPSVDRVVAETVDLYRATFAGRRISFYLFIFTVLRGAPPSSLVTYPDPDDEFFGYTQKRIPVWYPSAIDEGLKEMVTAATRIAIALVAIQAGRYAGTKSESIRLSPSDRSQRYWRRR